MQSYLDKNRKNTFQIFRNMLCVLSNFKNGFKNKFKKIQNSFKTSTKFHFKRRLDNFTINLDSRLNSNQCVSFKFQGTKRFITKLSQIQKEILTVSKDVFDNFTIKCRFKFQKISKDVSTISQSMSIQVLNLSKEEFSKKFNSMKNQEKDS